MMTEREQKASYPLAAANGYPRSDAEAARGSSDQELRRKKRMKWLIYIVAFVIFQTGVIVLFSMTVMKFRTPKFRVRQATFDTFEVETSSASFNLRMNAQLGVKNSNFGPYKFDNTAIFFYYNGTQVGRAAVRKSKANFRSTKKLDVEVELVAPANLQGSSKLAADLGSGILPLTGQSKLNGKVTIMFMFKKKKSANLQCTMDVNMSTKQVQNLKC